MTDPAVRDITPSTAFSTGFRAALGVPPMMVMFAMIGFGSLAKSQDLGLLTTLFTAAAIYGMPGQVAMLELYATGATAAAVVAGVAMANMRFFPMAVVLMPLFSDKEHWYRWRYVIVQFMSINSWTHARDVLPELPDNTRLGFFTGFAVVCFMGGMIGSAAGWMLASVFPPAVTLTLVFLNPAYFIFLFCCNTRPDIVLSLVFGCLLGPPLYLLSPDWGLPVCGLLAGSLGFLLSRMFGAVQ